MVLGEFAKIKREWSEGEESFDTLRMTVSSQELKNSDKRIIHWE